MGAGGSGHCVTVRKRSNWPPWKRHPALVCLLCSVGIFTSLSHAEWRLWAGLPVSSVCGLQLPTPSPLSAGHPWHLLL